MFRPSPVLFRHVRFWLSAAADLLFPPLCVGCRAPGRPFCAVCAQRVEPIDGPLCPRCGRQQPQPQRRCPLCRAEERPVLTMVRGAAFHTTPLREAIHAFKYENRRDLAEPLARYLVAAFAGSSWQNARRQIDAVVPVPLHAQRLQERGYNQATLLADAFCRRTGLPCRPEWLLRSQFTQSQVGLSVRERRENVARAFVAHPEIDGQTLLLVDDVYTTGATLRACAEAAVDAGAGPIYGLALALPRRPVPPVSGHLS